LGEWVLTGALAQLAHWRRQSNRPLRMSVNVSPTQLSDPHFVSVVAAALGRAGVPPEALTVELTETVLSEDTEGIAGRLWELRSLGARIALDDFGTAYNSFSYMRQFPLDGIKIDRSFVQAVGEDTGALLLRSLIDVSESLGLSVVAEGIETVTQYEWLRANGCTHGQGFWFGRPVAASDVALPADPGVRLLSRGARPGQLEGPPGDRREGVG
jgi:EAL domain-containing protein (putative c-di-GMP-specific phosphodiesterase class I)